MFNRYKRMKKFKRVGLPGAMALMVLAASPCRPAHAADLTWSGALSTFWDDQFGSLVVITNWFPGGVAGAGDNVLFSDAASTTTVILNGNRTVSSVAFEGASNYGLSGSVLTIQTGGLTATGGATHSINSTVSLGADAVWDIDSGTTVNAPGIFGGSGSFTLTKNGGGTLNLSSPSTHGWTTVNAGALRATSDDLLGVAGAGLTLADGTTLRTGGNFAFDAARTLSLTGGEATIEVASSSSDAAWAGAIEGAGGIRVTGDGTFSITSAADNTNTGLSTVAGGNLELQTPAGVAALGGDISVHSAGRLDFTEDDQTPGDTDLTVTNSLADLNGTTQRFKDLELALSGSLLMSNATFYADSLQGTSNQFNIGTNANVSTKQVIGTLNQGMSTFSPGDGTGSAVITGDYVFSRGNLEIEIDGTTPGTEHDHLDVQGNFDLQPFDLSFPILDVLLGELYQPGVGDRYDIFDFGSINSTFFAINLPTINPGLAWDTSDLYTDGVLAVLPTLPGDFDFDGDVDNADAAVLIGGFGAASGAMYASGDVDLDGDVDNADAAVFIGNFGTGTASLVDASLNAELQRLAAVPEPGSLAALLVGGLFVLRRRRD